MLPRMSLARLLCATATALLLALFSLAQDPPKDPPALQGSTRSEKYDFNWESACKRDREQRKHTLSYTVKNESKRYFLPVSWEDAGIEFQEIAVGGDAKAHQDTSHDYHTKSDSKIVYGEKQDLSREKVEIYLSTAQEQAHANPPLTTRIYAELHTKYGNRIVDFTLTSEVKKTAYTYRTANYTSVDQKFSVLGAKPSVSPVLEALKTTIGADVKTTWKRDPETADERLHLAVPNALYKDAGYKEGDTYTVEVRRPSMPVESQVRIVLYDFDGKTILASSKANIYIPKFDD